MKMIVRIDDVGFTDVCNIGAFETLDNGVATAADVMLECPGTVDALLRLTRYPWISVGWHAHMWGTPVLGGDKVPSLTEHGGEFDGRFRTDLRTAQDVDEAEAYAELTAQLERCRAILGRYPDTGAGVRGDSPFCRAMTRVQQERNIPTGFMSRQPGDPRTTEKILAGQARGEKWAFLYNPKGMPASQADPKWAGRKIVNADGGLPYMDLWTDSISEVEENYDPVLYYTQDRAGILSLPEDVIFEQSWHPGYLDYFVYRLGERANRPRARQFTVARCQDVAALCDQRLKDWIRDNGIELVNFRDALYGTSEYQTHLKQIHSPLCRI